MSRRTSLEPGNADTYFIRSQRRIMSEEFDVDIGKKVKIFLKIGRKYEGKIIRSSKDNFIHLKDKFDKLVKIAEDNLGSVEYE